MRKIEILVLLVIFVFLALLPLLFPNPSVTSIAFFAIIFAVAAAGWNIFSGYSGYISLGYAVFSGVGAYSLALMCQKWKMYFP